MEPSTQSPRWLFVGTMLVALLLIGGWFALNNLQKQPVDHKISSLVLSRSGRWLAAGTAQGRIILRDQKSGAVVRQIQFEGGPLNDLQFSPDETRLAAAGRDLATFDLALQSEPHYLKKDQRNYGTVRYSDDGGSLLVVTGSSAIELLDAQSGAPRFSVCCSTIDGEVAFTPDRKTVVNAGHWPRLWNSHSGQMAGQLLPTQRTYPFRSIAFDGAGATVAMGSQDGRVYVWDLPGRRLAAVSEPQTEYVDAVSMTSAGWIVYTASGKTLRLWNPATGKYRILEGAHPTSNVIPSPDGTTVLFGTATATIESWNLDTGQRLAVTQIPDPKEN